MIGKFGHIIQSRNVTGGDLVASVFLLRNYFDTIIEVCWGFFICLLVCFFFFF